MDSIFSLESDVRGLDGLWFVERIFPLLWMGGSCDGGTFNGAIEWCLQRWITAVSEYEDWVEQKSRSVGGEAENNANGVGKSENRNEFSVAERNSNIVSAFSMEINAEQPFFDFSCSFVEWPSLLSSLYLMQGTQCVRFPLYRQMARDMQSGSDYSVYSRLMMWCLKNSVFVHPHLFVRREPSIFRDYRFYVAENIHRLTPLLAIPESLLLGFQAVEVLSSTNDRGDGTTFKSSVLDETKGNDCISPRVEVNEGEVHIVEDSNDKKQGGSFPTSSEADMCSFFFSSLNMMVSNIISAKGSSLTDKRYAFADFLSKVRTVYNAPYFDASVVLQIPTGSVPPIHASSSGNSVAACFPTPCLPTKKSCSQDAGNEVFQPGSSPLIENSGLQDEKDSVCLSTACESKVKNETTMSSTSSLADVLLQMIRNYVDAGPFAQKIPKDDIRWMVSVCLAHSTPLTIGDTASIGIIPLVHLFPHGGEKTNSFVVARRQKDSALRMAKGIAAHCGLDFTRDQEAKWVYLIPERDVAQGEEVCVQALAPACDSDSEAEQMWRLSCGAAPPAYITSAKIEEKRQQLLEEMIERGMQHSASPRKAL